LLGAVSKLMLHSYRSELWCSCQHGTADHTYVHKHTVILYIHIGLRGRCAGCTQAHSNFLKSSFPFELKFFLRRKFKIEFSLYLKQFLLRFILFSVFGE